MPVVNASRSPRSPKWRGMKPSARQDGGQPRERRERGVRGEHQDERGEGEEQQVAQGVGAEHMARDLRDDGALVVGDHPEAAGQERDAHEQHGEQHGHHAQGRRRVAGLRGLEGRHARRDRLDTGQRRGTRREGPQQQHEQGDRRQLLAGTDGAGRRAALALHHDLERAQDDHQEGHRHEQVRGAAKMLPDSRSPRRLPSVTSTMAATAISTWMSCRSGRAATTCSLADEMLTATVRM